MPEHVEKELVTSKEICIIANMSDSSLRKYLEDPDFPRYKIHNDLRYKPSEVLEFLRVKSND